MGRGQRDRGYSEGLESDLDPWAVALLGMKGEEPRSEAQ